MVAAPNKNTQNKSNPNNPFKPGDWVSLKGDTVSYKVAKVSGNECLLDLNGTTFWQLASVLQPASAPVANHPQGHGKKKKNRHGGDRKFEATSNYGPTANRGKFSLTESVAAAIHGGASMKAKFWIWIGIASVLMFLNAKFYVWLLSSVFSMPIILAALFGTAFSFVTTAFEAGPGIRKKSAKSALERMFLAASKPSKLPVISGRQSQNAAEMYSNYSGVDQKNAKDDEAVRWGLIAFESVVGIIFMATVGTGIQALGAIVMFVLSVFGAEHAVVKAVRVHESVLPPKVAAQLRKVWRNADRDLELR